METTNVWKSQCEKSTLNDGPSAEGAIEAELKMTF